MKYNLKQISNLVDGRLITEMDDIYDMSSTYTGQSLMTHNLPTPMRFLAKDRPTWFVEAETILNKIKAQRSLKISGDSEKTEKEIDFKLYERYIDNEIPNYLNKPCTEIMFDIEEYSNIPEVVKYLSENNPLFGVIIMSKKIIKNTVFEQGELRIDVCTYDDTFNLCRVEF